MEMIMDPKPTCPICGSPMWRVIVEGSEDGAASHFECFFHIGDKPLGSTVTPLSRWSAPIKEDQGHPREPRALNRRREHSDGDGGPM